MSVIGVLLPIRAAGEEPAASRRVLTLNGRPLSHLLNSAMALEALSQATSADRGGGQISGIALDANGQSLAVHALRLRSAAGQATATPLVATTRTDAEGRFSFTALSQGRYVVDVLRGDQIVATSGLIALAVEGMTFIQVGGMPAQESATDDRNGKGVLFWTAVGAGAGAATGLILIAGNTDCRRAESLCPLAPIMLGITGALMGLLVGL